MISDLTLRGEQIHDHSSLKGDHGQGQCQDVPLIRVFGTHSKALTILAHKLARAIYYMLKRRVAFDLDAFLQG